MKPVLEYLPPDHQESFFAKAFDLPYFGTPWHYHREYELVLVTESHGKRFIGNAVSEFKDGYLTFLGQISLIFIAIPRTIIKTIRVSVQSLSSFIFLKNPWDLIFWLCHK